MSILPWLFRTESNYLSCGNVGKLTRIADVVATPEFTTLHPRKNPQAPFLVLGGYIDFLVPSAYVNGHGAITGLANLAPVSFVIVIFTV